MFPWKTALVTGASAGIGEAITEQLIAGGVHTTVVARRGDRLQDAGRLVEDGYGAGDSALGCGRTGWQA